MNILLINVSLRPESKLKLFPIGIGYIATAMKQADFLFDYLDIDVHRYTEDEVETFIKNKSYDVICMGCIVTGYKYIKQLCAVVRKYHPKSYIVVGNSVATSIYETLLTMTEADIAVMGEGDITIVELLKTITSKQPLSNVLGITYKKDGKIYKNALRPPIENISVLPHIDFSLFDVEKYIENTPEQINETVPLPRESLRALPINTARGCIADCTFCYHNFRGCKYRYRSMDSIVTELKEMVKKYNLNYVFVGDELTFFSRKRAQEFANAILKNDLHFYWEGTCRADCFKLNEDVEILKDLKRAGCVSIAYSLESAEPEILKAMNKHISVDDFSRTTELIHKAGLIPTTSLVIGYPQETVESIKKTFDCCIENGIYPSAGYLLPQPGSIMYDYARAHGFIEDEEEYLLKLGDRQDLRINMTKMTDEEMENAVLEGLQKCNEKMHVGLKKENLIKTQYYRTKKQ